MSVISWRADVNTTILDSTTISIGEGGYKEETNDNGIKNRKITTFAYPDKYNVTMDFDWLEKDENGFSEFDRFVRWYKYRHQQGSNPFWFESISRFNINGPLINKDGKPTMCQYKITSGLNCQKSGFCMRVTMTWEEVYSGLVVYNTPENKVDHLTTENGLFHVYFQNNLEEIPTVTSLNFKYIDLKDTSKSVLNINDYTVFATPSRVTASAKEANFYLEELPKGDYKIIIDNNSEDLSSMIYSILVVKE